MRRAKPVGEGGRVTPPANLFSLAGFAPRPEGIILRSMKDLKEGVESLFTEAQAKGDRLLDPELSMDAGMRLNRVGGDKKPNAKTIGTYSRSQPPKPR